MFHVKHDEGETVKYNDLDEGIRDIHALSLSMMLDKIRRNDPSHPVDAGQPGTWIYEGLTEEQAYAERNPAVVGAVGLAMLLGWRAGFAVDIVGDPGWPVAYIDIPGHGQVSWHLPAYPGTYDGHTTEEKYDRISDWDGEEIAAAEARRRKASGR